MCARLQVFGVGACVCVCVHACFVVIQFVTAHVSMHRHPVNIFIVSVNFIFPHLYNCYSIYWCFCIPPLSYYSCMSYILFVSCHIIIKAHSFFVFCFFYFAYHSNFSTNTSPIYFIYRFNLVYCSFEVFISVCLCPLFAVTLFLLSLYVFSFYFALLYPINICCFNNPISQWGLLKFHLNFLYLTLFQH